MQKSFVSSINAIMISTSWLIFEQKPVPYINNHISAPSLLIYGLTHCYRGWWMEEAHCIIACHTQFTRVFIFILYGFWGPAKFDSYHDYVSSSKTYQIIQWISMRNSRFRHELSFHESLNKRRRILFDADVFPAHKIRKKFINKIADYLFLELLCLQFVKYLWLFDFNGIELDLAVAHCIWKLKWVLIWQEGRSPPKFYFFQPSNWTESYSHSHSLSVSASEIPFSLSLLMYRNNLHSTLYYLHNQKNWCFFVWREKKRFERKVRVSREKIIFLENKSAKCEREKNEATTTVKVLLCMCIAATRWTRMHSYGSVTVCYCSSLLYDKSIDYQAGWKSEQKPYVETGDMQFNLLALALSRTLALCHSTVSSAQRQFAHWNSIWFTEWIFIIAACSLDVLACAFSLVFSPCLSLSFTQPIRFGFVLVFFCFFVHPAFHFVGVWL